MSLVRPRIARHEEEDPVGFAGRVAGWGGSEASATLMKTPVLYALYRRSYHDYDRPNGDPNVGRFPPRRIEAVIAEFAEEDARNGRPCRSLAEFERSVATGLGALSPLGLAVA